MKDDEKIQTYLRRQLQKEPTYKVLLKELEETLIAGAYLNLYSEDDETRTIAKTMCWSSMQQKIKTLWSNTRGLIPLYVDLQGNAKV